MLSETAEDEIFGMVRMAGVDVALPLAALREVVPCPDRLACLPAAAPGLLGALELRTTVLPVVDLRVLLHRDTDRHPAQVVVVVAHGGQALGLLADEVCGMTRVPPSALLPMRSADGELLFDAAFRHPDTGRPISVLDAAAVLRRPGVPTVTDVTRSAAAVAAEGRAARRQAGGRRVTLVQCGPHVLALDVRSVHTTLPRPEVRPSVLTGGACLGVTPYADLEIALVDPLALLGLGRRTEPPGAGVVLDVAGGYVVLAVDALLDLADLADDQLFPLPSFAVPRPDLLAGLAHPGGRPAFVLDGDRMAADADLRGLAACATGISGDPGAGTTGRGVDAASRRRRPPDGPPYLVYSVGVDLASPLDGVEEIVPFPTELTATAVGGATLGVVVHRAAAVPVVSLAGLLGLPVRPPTAASCLLLVAAGTGCVGLAVDSLRSIDPLGWTDPDQVRGAPGSGPLQAAPLVRVGDSERLLPDLDLGALVRGLGGERSSRQEWRAPAGPAPAVAVPIG